MSCSPCYVIMLLYLFFLYDVRHDDKRMILHSMKWYYSNRFNSNNYQLNIVLPCLLEVDMIENCYFRNCLNKCHDQTCFFFMSCQRKPLLFWISSDLTKKLPHSWIVVEVFPFLNLLLLLSSRVSHWPRNLMSDSLV